MFCFKKIKLLFLNDIKLTPSIFNKIHSRKENVWEITILRLPTKESRYSITIIKLTIKTLRTLSNIFLKIQTIFS